MSNFIGDIDVSTYNTCRHPEDFYADWSGYYRRAFRWRSRVLDNFPHELGVQYGDHPHQIMNVFWPGAADAPVVLYFHGGGWREGHPNFYDHLAEPWVAAGAVFVSCGYRAAAEVDISTEVDDAAQALTHLARDVRRFGGDPHRITVSGHSAGGHLAAMVTLTGRGPSLDPREAAVAGGIYMSSPLNLIEDVMPDDPETAHALSPAIQATKAPPSVVLSFASPEPNKKGEAQDYDRRHAQALSAALDRLEAPHTIVSLGHLDHVATAMAFADVTSPLYAAAYRTVFGAVRP